MTKDTALADDSIVNQGSFANDPVPMTQPGDENLTLQEKVFNQLMTDEHNRFCFDCGSENPEYVSLNQGVFLCFNCAVCIH